jgi:signal transduction histidine kinase
VLRTGGSDAAGTARQAALLFVLSGLSAFAAIPSEPDDAGLLTIIAVADLVTALVSWVLPWNRCDPALRVYADPERLEQVLVNLVANAVRHGQPPVVVSAENLRSRCATRAG